MVNKSITEKRIGSWLPQSAGIMQASVRAWIQHTHPRSTAIQIESGQRARATQEDRTLVVVVAFLARSQSAAEDWKGTDGGTIGRN